MLQKVGLCRASTTRASLAASDVEVQAALLQGAEEVVVQRDRVVVVARGQHDLDRVALAPDADLQRGRGIRGWVGFTGCGFIAPLMAGCAH